jgi:hypothetical protein
MGNEGPVIGKEDLFEGIYKEKLRSLVRPHGEFVGYERDRAAVDLGIQLTESSGTMGRVSHTRIWFQLKGHHKDTLSLAEFERATDIRVKVAVEHLRFWFASPEPIYLAVYVEAADLFLAEDVRELVYRRWGEDFLSPATFPPGQQEVTVRMRTDAGLTGERLEAMRRHQSMRIDGPFFRGRPLGHRLDPLRCGLNEVQPDVFVKLVQRLLDVHDYRVTELLKVGDLLSGQALADEHASLSVGRLYTTFEWVSQLMTEFGVGPDDDFRIEGAPQFAHGPTAVLIHGEPITRPTHDALHAFAQALIARGIRRLLVFANTDEIAYFGSFSAGFRGTGVACMPELLPDLAYNLLTATVVYLEFRESVSWKWTNYL